MKEVANIVIAIVFISWAIANIVQSALISYLIFKLSVKEAIEEVLDK